METRSSQSFTKEPPGYETNIKIHSSPPRLPPTSLHQSDFLQGFLLQQEKLRGSSGQRRRQEVAAASQMKYLVCYCVNAESSTWLLPPGEEEYLGPAANAC